MWNEREMTNAFSRRVARDMPYMPKPMLIGFYIADYLQRFRTVVTLLCMLTMISLILLIIHKAIFALNTMLISHNPMMEILHAVGVSLTFYWLISVAFNAMVMSWYYRARNTFKAG